jgi:hypothetical protein
MLDGLVDAEWFSDDRDIGVRVRSQATWQEMTKEMRDTFPVGGMVVTVWKGE